MQRWDQMLMMEKGDEVEVMSEAEGFRGAWFKAVSEEKPTNSGKKKIRVRYLTLVADDNTCPLIETVEQSLIRPVPPVDKYQDIVLEEGVVVDADHRDGWWKGMVVKVMEQGDYLVSLDTSPSHAIRFDKRQLRAHIRWNGWMWVRPEIQQVDKSMYCSWTSASPLKQTVPETRETTSFQKTLNEQVSNQSAMETETSQVEPIAKEAVSFVTLSPVITASPLKQPVAEAREITYFAKTLEQVRNQSAMETDTTQLKMQEESRKRKRDQEQHFNSNEIDGTCNGSTTEIDDTISKKICNDGDVNDQPLSSLIEQSSLDQNPNMAKNSAAITHVDKARGEDRVTSLPFAKKSPYWKTCETTESFKTVPQRPHFSPLYEEAKEELREWSAVGMMVTFYGYLDEIKTLKLDDPPSKLNGLSVSLAELEKHGFDVETAQLRIKRMLSLQDDRKMNKEENKCFEERIEEEGSKTRKVEEELVELKRKVLEVQRLQAVAGEKKKEGEKKMVEMKASAVTIEQKLEEVEVEFQKTASAPW